MTDIHEDSLLTSDGQEIGYVRVGKGPPLVICYGALTVAEHWIECARALAATRTVYLYDRRGRGRSVPETSAVYAFEREVDDLAAMVRLAGDDAAVLGHSFGGGCALAYALEAGFSGDLILYEPVHSIERPISGGKTDELCATIAEQGKDEGLAFALLNIIRLPAEQVSGLRQTPLWPSLASVVGLFPRELAGLDRLDFQGLAEMPFPARLTLLLGTASPMNPNGDACEQIAHRISGTRTVKLEGQGHVAHLTDPAGLASTVEQVLAR